MITSFAVFLTVVSVLAAVAAWIGEEGVRRLGAPTRWVWLASLAAGPLLLVAGLLPERAPSALPGPGTIAPVVELSPLVLAPGGAGIDDVFGVLWALLSTGLVLLLLWTSAGLSRARRRWDRMEVLGRPVYVSQRRGPAVAGFFRPWIVLPRWALSLPDRDLGLVVLHEEEHVRARDSALLGLCLALVVATPWNPVTWWQLRRLRAAMEMDCDRRVLRREPDRQRYGESLLSIAERSSGPSLGLAAFSESPISLERRIIAMTWKSSRWAPLKAGLLILLAMVVAVQACGVAIPLVDDPVESQPAVDAEKVEPPRVEIPAPASESEVPPPPPAVPEPAAPDVDAQLAEREPSPEPSSEPPPDRDLSEEPMFTPFTVAPSILNRSEVIEAMIESYPPLLREAGIGGSIRVYFFIDEEGRVGDVRIDQSSGHPALDDAALRVAGVYRFTPALNRDEPVPVWVSFPITFQIR